MPTDPYKILGVRRNASPAAVRRAYRKLALKHHPDRGGDAAAFQAVTEAHEVLSDPQRRAKYDATGDASEPKPSAELMAIMSVLSPCLISVVMGLVKDGHSVTTEHVVERMRSWLADAQGKLKAGIAELTKTKAALEAAAPRFTIHDGENNLLASAAKCHLDQVAQRLAAVTAESERVAKAVEHLKTCGYTVDAKAAGAFDMYTPLGYTKPFFNSGAW